MSRFFLILGIPLTFGLVTFLVLRSLFLAPVDRNDTQEISVLVTPGMSFGEIANELESQRIIRSALGLRILSRLRSEDTKVSSGEYAFTRNLTPKEILQKLISGETIKRVVTIIPGMTIWEVAKAIGASGLITEAEAKKALTDPALLKRWAVNGLSFEGYLYPETYHFSRPITPNDIIGTFVKEGEKQWLSEFTPRSLELRMSRHEILTLASIIEKETSIADERGLVASVFHNRLKQGMKLQSDPTVIYGIPNFNGNITKKDLETPSIYNTYTNFGLPPGPIGAPTIGSIKAALYPATSDYLFFVADGKGGHRFSATYREHRDNVTDFVALKKDSSSSPMPNQ